MKNNEWIELPIYNTSIYPKKIRDIAKKVGSPVEEIAESEGVDPGCILVEWIKREDIMQVFRLLQYPDDENMSILLLLTGEELVVNMPHRKLMGKIHKFLMQEHQYDFEQEGEFMTVPVNEEGMQEG